MSGVYHLLGDTNPGRAVLQRLDHAAIFILIVGTMTPLHSVLFAGFMRWGWLLLIWSLAITAITLKTIFFHAVPEWLGLTFYTGGRLQRTFGGGNRTWGAAPGLGETGVA